MSRRALCVIVRDRPRFEEFRFEGSRCLFRNQRAPNPQPNLYSRVWVGRNDTDQTLQKCAPSRWGWPPFDLPFESKLLPAVLSLLRIYYPKVTVTNTVLKFGWICLIAITVTVVAFAVTPAFPLIPNYHLESHWVHFWLNYATVLKLNVLELER